MGYRFWRSVRVAPGVRLNLSKSGPSLSFGPRGAKFTVGMGGTRTTVGVPGTGIYYTHRNSYGSKAGSTRTPAVPHPEPTAAGNLTLGFFQKLITPPAEQEFVNGCREMALGSKAVALTHFENALHIPDAAYLAATICSETDRLVDAERYFTLAAQRPDELGKMLTRYGIAATVMIHITDEFTAFIPVTERGILIALVEIYQAEKRYAEASKTLQRLYDLDPSDLVVRLSIAEIYMETRPKDEIACKKVLQLTEGIENDSPVHAAILLYKAKALCRLNMPTAAIEVLSKIIRKTKDRSDDLLNAIRYERALAYQAAGQNGRYRADLEKLYAAAPDYEDVAERLKV